MGSHRSLCQPERVPPLLVVPERFDDEWVKFITCFFCIFGDDHLFLFLLYLPYVVNCIALFFLILSPSCIPRINTTLSQYILFTYCWVSFAKTSLKRNNGRQFSVFITCLVLVSG